MNQRRLEGRFLCADLVKLDWVCDGKLVAVEAVLEDISPLGACVQVDEPVAPGSAISMSVRSASLGSDEEAHFSGVVSYCVFRDYGYFVGIQLSDTTRWSSGIFEPQHMTNLAELTAIDD